MGHVAITYLQPNDWGMRWVREPVAHEMPVPEVYLHHTAGSHPDDPAEAFREMNERAIRPRAEGGDGYSAIDYSLLCHRSRRTGALTIGEARGPWMPAATKSRNRVSKAVCLLGYFHPGHALSREPHPDEYEMMAEAVAVCYRKGWATRSAIVRGHRDNPAHPGATECPGAYLLPHVDAIADRALVLAGAAPSRPATITVEPGEGWWALARRAGVDVDDLLLANVPELHPGDRIELPE